MGFCGLCASPFCNSKGSFGCFHCLLLFLCPILVLVPQVSLTTCFGVPLACSFCLGACFVMHSRAQPEPTLLSFSCMSQTLTIGSTVLRQYLVCVENACLGDLEFPGVSCPTLTRPNRSSGNTPLSYSCHGYALGLGRVREDRIGGSSGFYMQSVGVCRVRRV